MCVELKMKMKMKMQSKSREPYLRIQRAQTALRVARMAQAAAQSSGAPVPPPSVARLVPPSHPFALLGLRVCKLIDEMRCVKAL
jgi:hypothetical protein